MSFYDGEKEIRHFWPHFVEAKSESFYNRKTNNPQKDA